MEDNLAFNFNCNLKYNVQYLHQVNPLKCKRLWIIADNIYQAAAITAVFFFYNTDIANTTLELSKLNWASIALGICIVGLELGYIFLYRAGANVSSASLIANICLAIALVIVGVIMYKEHVTSQQLIGIVVCIIGIILITK